MNPLVSIVIPSYQSAQWVHDAVSSALAQTHTPCEVIVVDDGSTDGTAKLLDSAFSSTIRIHRQSNRGLAAARNAGLALARGDYVQFLDADDVLLPEKIATQVAALEHAPEFDIAFSDFAWLEGGEPRASGMPVPRLPDGNALPALLARNFIVAHAVLARTAALRGVGGFDENLTACEDYDLWLRLAGAGTRFLHTPGDLVLYRRTPGSMSAHSERQYVATALVLARAAQRGLDGATESRARLRRHLAGVHSMIARIRAADALRLAARGRVIAAASRMRASADSFGDMLRTLVPRRRT